MKLSPFGQGSVGYLNGYTLPVLVGWIEYLVDEESNKVSFKMSRGKLTKKEFRIEKVEEALKLLNEALDMGNEYDD